MCSREHARGVVSVQQIAVRHQFCTNYISENHGKYLARHTACRDLEDIILTGATKTQHLEMLDMVCGQLEEVGVRFKRKQCTFLANEVVYLGYRINQHGLHPVQDKVEAIQKARSPQNVLELQTFLGLLMNN